MTQFSLLSLVNHCLTTIVLTFIIYEKGDCRFWSWPNMILFQYLLITPSLWPCHLTPLPSQQKRTRIEAITTKWPILTAFAYPKAFYLVSSMWCCCGSIPLYFLFASSEWILFSCPVVSQLVWWCQIEWWNGINTHNSCLIDHLQRHAFSLDSDKMIAKWRDWNFLNLGMFGVLFCFVWCSSKVQDIPKLSSAECINGLKFPRVSFTK